MKRLLGVFTMALFFCSISQAQERNRIHSAPEQVCPVLTGTPAPGVSFATMDGGTLSLKAALAEKPVVLIFYRGGW